MPLACLVFFLVFFFLVYVLQFLIHFAVIFWGSSRVVAATYLSHSLFLLSLSFVLCPALVACVAALRVKCAHCAELLQPSGVSSAADAALGGQRAVGLVVQTQLVLLLL